MKDTVNLLRECDAGVKMGIRSIDDVLSHVKSEKLKNMLTNCKDSRKRVEQTSLATINFRVFYRHSPCKVHT